MRYMDEQTDQSKQEISRLQLELQGYQRMDRQRDGMGNQTVIKLERQVGTLTQELIYSDEKYEKLHQKYLEERRRQENEIALLEDKYSKDISYYQSKLDHQKERTKAIKQDNEQTKARLLQS